MLDERRGKVVTREDILARVWDGRSVSGNSLALVIGALRRALAEIAGDSARIETVSKGGYRLVVVPPIDIPTGEATPFAWRWAAAATIVLLLLVAAIMTWPRAQPSLVIDEVVNATGEPRYHSLANASGELLVVGLSHDPALIVHRSVDRDVPATLHLRSRLVLWEGDPDLVMTLEDSASGKIVWSGFASGPEHQFPSLIAARVRTLRAAIGGETGAARR